MVSNEDPEVILHDTSVGEMSVRLTTWNDGLFFQHDSNNDLNAPNWLSTFYLQNNTGNVNPSFAKVAGDVHAARYCDENGNNCRSITDIGGTISNGTQAGRFVRPASGVGSGDVTHIGWVTFDQPFDSVPTISTSDIRANIILNCSGSPMTPQGTITVTNVTKTGFEAHLRHYVSGCEYWRSDSFHWVANTY